MNKQHLSELIESVSLDVALANRTGIDANLANAQTRLAQLATAIGDDKLAAEITLRAENKIPTPPPPAPGRRTIRPDADIANADWIKSPLLREAAIRDAEDDERLGRTGDDAIAGPTAREWLAERRREGGRS